MPFDPNDGFQVSSNEDEVQAGITKTFEESAGGQGIFNSAYNAFRRGQIADKTRRYLKGDDSVAEELDRLMREEMVDQYKPSEGMEKLTRNELPGLGDIPGIAKDLVGDIAYEGGRAMAAGSSGAGVGRAASAFVPHPVAKVGLPVLGGMIGGAINAFDNAEDQYLLEEVLALSGKQDVTVKDLEIIRENKDDLNRLFKEARTVGTYEAAVGALTGALAQLNVIPNPVSNKMVSALINTNRKTGGKIVGDATAAGAGMGLGLAAEVATENVRGEQVTLANALSPLVDVTTVAGQSALSKMDQDNTRDARSRIEEGMDKVYNAEDYEGYVKEPIETPEPFAGDQRISDEPVRGSDDDILDTEINEIRRNQGGLTREETGLTNRQLSRLVDEKNRRAVDEDDGIVTQGTDDMISAEEMQRKRDIEIDDLNNERDAEMVEQSDLHDMSPEERQRRQYMELDDLKNERGAELSTQENLDTMSPAERQRRQYMELDDMNQGRDVDMELEGDEVQGRDSADARRYAEIFNLNNPPRNEDGSLDLSALPEDIEPDPMPEVDGADALVDDDAVVGESDLDMPLAEEEVEVEADDRVPYIQDEQDPYAESSLREFSEFDTLPEDYQARYDSLDDTTRAKVNRAIMGSRKAVSSPEAFEAATREVLDAPEKLPEFQPEVDPPNPRVKLRPGQRAENDAGVADAEVADAEVNDFPEDEVVGETDLDMPPVPAEEPPLATNKPPVKLKLTPKDKPAAVTPVTTKSKSKFVSSPEFQALSKDKQDAYDNLNPVNKRRLQQIVKDSDEFEVDFDVAIEMLQQDNKPSPKKPVEKVESRKLEDITPDDVVTRTEVNKLRKLSDDQKEAMAEGWPASFVEQVFGKRWSEKYFNARDIPSTAQLEKLRALPEGEKRKIAEGRDRAEVEELFGREWADSFFPGPKQKQPNPVKAANTRLAEPTTTIEKAANDKVDEVIVATGAETNSPDVTSNRTAEPTAVKAATAKAINKAAEKKPAAQTTEKVFIPEDNPAHPNFYDKFFDEETGDIDQRRVEAAIRRWKKAHPNVEPEDNVLKDSEDFDGVGDFTNEDLGIPDEDVDISHYGDMTSFAIDGDTPPETPPITEKVKKKVRVAVDDIMKKYGSRVVIDNDAPDAVTYGNDGKVRINPKRVTKAKLLDDQVRHMVAKGIRAENTVELNNLYSKLGGVEGILTKARKLGVSHLLADIPTHVPAGQRYLTNELLYHMHLAGDNDASSVLQKIASAIPGTSWRATAKLLAKGDKALREEMETNQYWGDVDSDVDPKVMSFLQLLKSEGGMEIRIVGQDSVGRMPFTIRGAKGAVSVEPNGKPVMWLNPKKIKNTNDAIETFVHEIVHYVLRSNRGIEAKVQKLANDPNLMDAAREVLGDDMFKSYRSVYANDRVMFAEEMIAQIEGRRMRRELEDAQDVSVRDFLDEYGYGEITEGMDIPGIIAAAKDEAKRAQMMYTRGNNLPVRMPSNRKVSYANSPRFGNLHPIVQRLTNNWVKYMSINRGLTNEAWKNIVRKRGEETAVSRETLTVSNLYNATVEGAKIKIADGKERKLNIDQRRSVSKVTYKVLTGEYDEDSAKSNLRSIGLKDGDVDAIYVIARRMRIEQDYRSESLVKSIVNQMMHYRNMDRFGKSNVMDIISLMNEAQIGAKRGEYLANFQRMIEDSDKKYPEPVIANAERVLNILDNMGTYLKRQYKAYDPGNRYAKHILNDPKKMARYTRWLRDEYMEKMKPELDELKGRLGRMERTDPDYQNVKDQIGAIENRPKEAFAADLERLLFNKEGMGDSRNELKFNTDQLRQRKDLSPKMRIILGEKTDDVVAAYQTSVEGTASIDIGIKLHQNLFDSLSAGGLITTGDGVRAIHGHNSMSIPTVDESAINQMSPLADTFTTEVVSFAVRDITEGSAHGDLFKLYRHLTSRVNEFKTVYSSAGQIINMVSNNIMSIVNGDFFYGDRNRSTMLKGTPMEHYRMLTMTNFGNTGNQHMFNIKTKLMLEGKGYINPKTGKFYKIQKRESQQIDPLVVRLMEEGVLGESVGLMEVSEFSDNRFPLLEGGLKRAAESAFDRGYDNTSIALDKAARGYRNFKQEARNMYSYSDDNFKLKAFLNNYDRIVKSDFRDYGANLRLGQDIEGQRNNQPYRLPNGKIARTQSGKVITHDMHNWAIARAAEKTRRGYLMYSESTKLVEMIRGFPLFGTFVMFPAAITTASKNLVTDAASAAANKDLSLNERMAPALLIAGVATVGIFAGEMSKALSGVSDEEDEAIRASMPEFKQDNLLVYWGRRDDGTPKVLDFSRLFIMDYVMKPFRTLLTGGDPALVDLGHAISELAAPYVSPQILTKGVYELARGISYDYQNPTSNPEAGFIESSLDRLTQFAVDMSPAVTSQIYRSGAGSPIDARYIDPSSPLENTLRNMIGLPLNERTTPTTIAQVLAKDWIQKRGNSRKLLSAELTNLNTNPDYKDIKKRLYQRYNREAENNDRIIRLVKGMLEAGADEKQMINALQSVSGMSRARAIRIVRGQQVDVYQLTGKELRASLNYALGQATSPEEMKEIRAMFNERLKMMLDAQAEWERDNGR